MRTAAKLISLTVILLFTSCQKSIRVDSGFLTSTTVGLTVKGSTVCSIDPLNYQFAFNRGRSEFRVHTDNMSDYYCVKLQHAPNSEGERIKGEIIWTDKSSIVSKKDLSFVVEQMDRSGKVWLWCRKEGIGALVQMTD